MTTATALDFGPATHLTCRACGETYPLGAAYACMECFGPLEVGYEIVAPTREDIAAGPPNIWRYRALLPVPENIAGLPGLNPGFTKLVRADNLARALGMRRLWVKDDTGNPTHSFKDRVVAVALSAAARARPADAVVRVHRQPRERSGRGSVPRGHGARRGHPGEPRGRQGHHDRRVRRDPHRRRRQLRRREPPLL